MATVVITELFQKRTIARALADLQWNILTYYKLIKTLHHLAIYVY